MFLYSVYDYTLHYTIYFQMCCIFIRNFWSKEHNIII